MNPPSWRLAPFYQRQPRPDFDEGSQRIRQLSLSRTPSCPLLFAHPEISHGISNKGLPLIRRDQISQLNIDQLSDRWTPKASLPPVLPDIPKTPTYDIVTDGDVRNMVTKVMKLT